MTFFPLLFQFLLTKTSYDVYNEENKTSLSQNMLKVIMKSCFVFAAQYFNQEFMCGEQDMNKKIYNSVSEYKEDVDVLLVDSCLYLDIYLREARTLECNGMKLVYIFHDL